MAVSCYFGLTESGKSYHVLKNLMPNWSKTIVYDIAKCFTGDSVYNAPSDKDFVKLFRQYKGKDKFSIIVRPDFKSNVKELYNKTINLAMALGRVAGIGYADGRVEPEKRIQMVTDEADFVCSSQFQSLMLKDLVNKGRHVNVDSHFIARVPMRIHPDIRSNASTIATFRLQNAREIPLFLENFGRELSAQIKDLPKYHRLEWKDNGEIKIFDASNLNYYGKS